MEILSPRPAQAAGGIPRNLVDMATLIEGSTDDESDSDDDSSYSESSIRNSSPVRDSPKDSSGREEDPLRAAETDSSEIDEGETSEDEPLIPVVRSESVDSIPSTSLLIADASRNADDDNDLSGSSSDGDDAHPDGVVIHAPIAFSQPRTSLTELMTEEIKRSQSTAPPSTAIPTVIRTKALSAISEEATSKASGRKRFPKARVIRKPPPGKPTIGAVNQ